MGPDDLQRLVFGELHQQQVAPPGADPESRGALHQQGLHAGPGRRALHGSTRLGSAETQQRSRHLHASFTFMQTVSGSIVPGRKLFLNSDLLLVRCRKQLFAFRIFKKAINTKKHQRDMKDG